MVMLNLTTQSGGRGTLDVDTSKMGDSAGAIEALARDDAIMVISPTRWVAAGKMLPKDIVDSIIAEATREDSTSRIANIAALTGLGIAIPQPEPAAVVPPRAAVPPPPPPRPIAHAVAPDPAYLHYHSPLSHQDSADYTVSKYVHGRTDTGYYQDSGLFAVWDMFKAKRAVPQDAEIPIIALDNKIKYPHIAQEAAAFDPREQTLDAALTYSKGPGVRVYAHNINNVHFALLIVEEDRSGNVKLGYLDPTDRVGKHAPEAIEREVRAIYAGKTVTPIAIPHDYHQTANGCAVHAAIYGRTVLEFAQTHPGESVFQQGLVTAINATTAEHRDMTRLRQFHMLPGGAFDTHAAQARELSPALSMFGDEDDRAARAERATVKAAIIGDLYAVGQRLGAVTVDQLEPALQGVYRQYAREDADFGQYVKPVDFVKAAQAIIKKGCIGESVEEYHSDHLFKGVNEQAVFGNRLIGTLQRAIVDIEEGVAVPPPPPARAKAAKPAVRFAEGHDVRLYEKGSPPSSPPLSPRGKEEPVISVEALWAMVTGDDRAKAQQLDAALLHVMQKSTAPTDLDRQCYQLLQQENKKEVPEIYTGIGLEVEFKEGGGCEVTAIKKGSRAGAAGIKPQDVITAYVGADGRNKTIETEADLIAIRQLGLEKGTVTLVMEGGATKDIPCNVFSGKEGEGKFSFQAAVLAQQAAEQGRKMAGVKMQTGGGADPAASSHASTVRSPIHTGLIRS